MEGSCACVATHCGCLSNGNCTCSTCWCASTTKETPSGEARGGVHAHANENAYCLCGENCKCNPCKCSKADVKVAGKSFCKCGENCQCENCDCPRADVATSELAALV